MYNVKIKLDNLKNNTQNCKELASLVPKHDANFNQSHFKSHNSHYILKDESNKTKICEPARKNMALKFVEWSNNGTAQKQKSAKSRSKSRSTSKKERYRQPTKKSTLKQTMFEINQPAQSPADKNANEKPNDDAVYVLYHEINTADNEAAKKHLKEVFETIMPSTLSPSVIDQLVYE